MQHGRIISHYRVEERLGAGGMGEVYRARDLALGRDVALKLLAEGFHPSLKVRLLREAEACARLQHPAIATFYEAGEAEGVAFIALEFVRGGTLRERLKGGGLPLQEALALVACLLEALSHAHAAGILHRDIKPENIMVTGPRSAKLLDFGLAKHLLTAEDPQAATATLVTGAGLIVGTVGYMSPEQLRGEDVDVRSDVFQVGAVLFEAVAGRPAFPGPSTTARIAAILSRDPEPLSGPGVPRDLDTVLARALARDPARRYATAAAFLSDLQRVAEDQTVADLPDTLAVVDLQNLSGDAADEWLGSGVAESLGADLSRAAGLTVIAREKVLKARAALLAAEPASSPIDLGLRLGCRFVLSGGFQRMGPALRVTTRLSEVSTGRVLAAEKIDGRVEGIFEIQDRLSAAALAALHLRAPTPAQPAVAQSVEAYECYARGRRLFTRLEKGSLDQARELYERAVARDAAYAPALAGLAAVHALRFTFTTQAADLEQSADFARRAIAADPGLAEPHIWLGYSLWRQGEGVRALEEERTVMALDPSAVFGPYFAAGICFSIGRREEAVDFFQRAIEVDSQGGFVWLGLGWTHLELGHASEARWCLERVLELERTGGSIPTAGGASYLGECLRRTGDLAAARARCLEGLETVERSDHMYRDTFRAVGLVALGRTSLEQGDPAAARAAFQQAAAHVRGRARMLGGGQILVQALAGLARAGDTDALDEALALFEARQGFDFSFFWCCSDEVSLLELARAARAAGRTEHARRLLDQARTAGSNEALAEEAT